MHKTYRVLLKLDGMCTFQPHPQPLNAENLSSFISLKKAKIFFTYFVNDVAQFRFKQILPSFDSINIIPFTFLIELRLALVG